MIESNKYSQGQELSYNILAKVRKIKTKNRLSNISLKSDLGQTLVW